MGLLDWFRRKPKTKAIIVAPTDVTASSWITSDAYRGAGAQWDPSKPAVELPIFGMPPATLVSAVAASLLQLEQGAFYSAAYLWDGMTRDDRIAGALNVRIQGLLGAPFDLLPAGDVDEQLAVKERFEKRWSKIAPSHQVAHLLRNGIGLSVGVAQVLSTRTTKGRDATIRVWNNRYLRYDWMLRQFRLVTQNRGEIAIDPDDEEWLIYEPYGPLGWLNGAAIRSLAMSFLIRHWSRTWWARRQEVHGQPIRAGILPAERDPRDERIFLQQLSNIAHEAVVRLPQGDDGNRFDLKLIEAQGRDWEGFSQLISHADRAITTVLLGQSASTDGQAGLGAQEKPGEAVLIRVLRGDSLVGDVIREGVLMPLARDNDGDPELAPHPNWNVDPPEDVEQKTKALLNVAQAVNTLSQAPEYAKHVDARALLEEHGLPLLPEEQTPPDVPGTPQSRPGDEEESDNEQAA